MALSDQDIAGAQEKSAGSVETRIYCGQVRNAHRIASGANGERGTGRAWSVEASSAGEGRVVLIIAQLKTVPQSKLKAPHRTCAVATSAALLLHMVAAPRTACRQISH